MRALEVGILALAVWRIASLLTYERGPFRVFERVRALSGIRHNDKGRPEVVPDGFWPELLSCVWCLSPYLGVGASVLYYLYGSAIVWVCLPLALSAGAIIIHRYAR